MRTLPSVTIAVLNYNGLQHLQDCFASVAAVDYPPDRLELMLVDNASTDDSAAFVGAMYPAVRIVRNEKNFGFGTGNNIAATEATGDYVVFLNNDMWVDRGLVRHLVEVVGSERACAAAKVVDWDGSHIDYAGSAAHFAGYGYQQDYGKPNVARPDEAARPTLFACGGAMLIDRRIFLDTGGFDDDYFIYYEDVDLGWRLWVLGYEVWYAPRAVAYHRHHGTMSGFADARKRVLYTRNALASAYKNYEDRNMGLAVSAALAGTIAGVVEGSSTAGLLDPDDFSFSTTRPAGGGDVALPPTEASALVALHDLAKILPRLVVRRQSIQARRRRSDDEIALLFRWPFAAWPGVDRVTQHRVVRELGIHRLYAAASRPILMLESAHGRATEVRRALEQRGQEVFAVAPGKEQGRRALDMLDIANAQAVIATDFSVVEPFVSFPPYVPLILDQARHVPQEQRRLAARPLSRVDAVSCPDKEVAESITPLLLDSGWSSDDVGHLLAIDTLGNEGELLIGFVLSAAARDTPFRRLHARRPVLIAKLVDTFRVSGARGVARKSIRYVQRLGQAGA